MKKKKKMMRTYKTEICYLTILYIYIYKIEEASDPDAEACAQDCGRHALEVGAGSCHKETSARIHEKV